MSWDAAAARDLDAELEADGDANAPYYDELNQAGMVEADRLQDEVEPVGPYEHTGAYAHAPRSFGAHLPSMADFAEALALLIGDACGDSTSSALSLAAAYLASDVGDFDPDRRVSSEAWLRSWSSFRRLRTLMAVQIRGLDALRDRPVQS